MKQIVVDTMVLALISIVPFLQMAAQPRFEVPLRVTDGVNADTLYFGILPDGHYCIDESDSINGHVEFVIPVLPPSGVFDTRFVWPRTGPDPLCFEQGSVHDFRPFISVVQKDTFRVKSQLGEGTAMVLSWPANLSTRFTQLTLRYFDQVVGNNVTVNMLTGTSADITSAGDVAVANIYAGGVPLSVEEVSRNVPQTFVLYQNFPNPFNPSTSIGFRIRESGFVSLKMLDVLGREVATIVNEQLTPGAHEKTFDANGLASGVYFYRLQAKGFVQTRKLLLMR